VVGATKRWSASGSFRRTVRFGYAGRSWGHRSEKIEAYDTVRRLVRVAMLTLGTRPDFGPFAGAVLIFDINFRLLGL